MTVYRHIVGRETNSHTVLAQNAEVKNLFGIYVASASSIEIQVPTSCILETQTNLPKSSKQFIECPSLLTSAAAPAPIDDDLPINKEATDGDWRLRPSKV